MRLFIVAPIASMATLQKGGTALPRLILTHPLCTEVLLLTPDVRPTESALLHVFLFFILRAGLSQMVRFYLAAGAEVVSTSIAPDSVGAHMLGSLLGESLPIFLLEVIVDLSLQ